MFQGKFCASSPIINKNKKVMSQSLNQLLQAKPILIKHSKQIINEYGPAHLPCLQPQPLQRLQW
jgi:hypothetical protein